LTLDNGDGVKVDQRREASTKTEEVKTRPFEDLRRTRTKKWEATQLGATRKIGKRGGKQGANLGGGKSGGGGVH